MKLAGLKQYIASKDQLLEALKRDPIHEAVYEITKYCKMPVGESKDSKHYIPLKPKQVVSVKWKYDNTDLDETPEPLSVTFNFMTENSSFDIFHSGEKMRKWLATNAFEVTKR